MKTTSCLLRKSRRPRLQQPLQTRTTPRLVRLCGVIGVCCIVTACTTGQANTTPPISSGGGPGGGSVALQLAVGTFNFNGVSAGLNVLETFRDTQGFTAIPITSTKLKVPPSFVAPKGSKDPGSGARGVIPIGSASNQFLIGPAGQTTTIGAADGFGIGPPSCSCPGINFYPFQPQFADVAASSTFLGGPEPFYGGPPAYPPTVLAASALSALVSIPSSWPEGFYAIALNGRPPTGAYGIDVTYLQNGVTTIRTASATLHTSLLLPKISKVNAISDGKGGLSLTVTLPARVKQVLANVLDSNVPPSPGATCATGLGFATLLFDRSGTLRVPDDLGNYGQGGAKTFCKGDLLSVQVIGFDYDDFDLGPPGNVQQRPPLPSQADITYTSVDIIE
jgi:hypothetical protein